MLKLLFAASAAAALLSGPALADDLAPQSVTLHVGRVNFDDPAQVHALYVHINNVAREACIEQRPDHAFMPVPPDLDCVNQVVAEAVGKISRPRLTALYENQAPALSPRKALVGNEQ